MIYFSLQYIYSWTTAPTSPKEGIEIYGQDKITSGRQAEYPHESTHSQSFYY